MSGSDTNDKRKQEIEAVYNEIATKIRGLELEKKQITIEFIKMLEEEKIQKIREELMK